MILNAVVLWVHIFGAIGWMGAAMVFGMVIGPSLPKLSGPARGEFFVRVAPKYIRYVEVFSIITLVFGVAMVAVLADGNSSIMSPSTSFGLYIAIGAVLALVAMGVAMAVIIPSAHKMVKIRVDDEEPGTSPAGAGRSREQVEAWFHGRDGPADPGDHIHGRGRQRLED